MHSVPIIAPEVLRNAVRQEKNVRDTMTRKKEISLPLTDDTIVYIGIQKNLHSTSTESSAK